MKSKLFVLTLMIAALLFFVAATLTMSPLEITDSIAFGTNLNKTITATLTFNNNGTTDVSGTITASSFIYSAVSLFPSTGLTISFNPSSITIPAGSSISTLASVVAPYNAYMGTYTSTLTLNTETFPLNVVIKSPDYKKNLKINEDDTTFPDSIRVGSDFIIKYKGNYIKNLASTDASNVAVDAWLYDETDKKIVSKDSLTLGTVKDGDEEEFDDDLELITDSLNSEHSYSLFIRAYSETDPSNYFAEEEIADIDLKSEEDLCDVGDLEVSDLDKDDIIFHGDKISPGEKITVPVTVENKGSSTIKDVVVRAWICKDDTACTWDDDHLDEYTVSKLDAKTINEDDEATFEIPLAIDEDVDDGDYRLRVEAYEKGEDDNNCFGDDVSIEIEKEDEELIIEKITIPSQLACGENFNVDARVSNIGDDDLEDIIVKVFEQSGKLGINKNSDSFDLDSDDSKTETFSFKIPSSATEGDYTFIVS
ncbi:MAG: CARDB domain-containing protein, partial [Nanoarchaeota archaeon]